MNRFTFGKVDQVRLAALLTQVNKLKGGGALNPDLMLKTVLKVA